MRKSINLSSFFSNFVKTLLNVEIEDFILTEYQTIYKENRS
ncbi:MAG: hypothetical protein RBR78_07800 [Flavobacteriaceae bacterium]|jgi:hypothetical protein|nr:hypothetical protein [Flavobacteriaceae bacterium]